MAVWRWSFLAAAVAAAACTSGRGPDSPTAPVDVPTFPLPVVVFYDEDANGRLDPNEVVRLSDVEVLSGTRTARTQAGGRATLQVPQGAVQVSVNPNTLPPYYVAAPPAAAVAPGTSDVLLPVTLPIGTNVRNKYLGFGDSITNGDGSSDDRGYRGRLEGMLRSRLGSATVVDEGQPGTRSFQGRLRVEDALAYGRPAYTLILYGTNDWNEASCKDSRFPCYTIESLQFMVREAKFISSLPFLATIPPVNVASNNTVRAPQERNDWVARINPLIRTLAVAEGAVLVDIHKAFVDAGGGRDLFSDEIHPSDRGYGIIADTFFRAITGPRSATTAGWAPERPIRRFSIFRGPDGLDP